MASWLAPFFGVGIYFGFSESCWSSPICFLDVVSIHQTDTELMERGVYGLGGFLKMSKELRASFFWLSPGSYSHRFKYGITSGMYCFHEKLNGILPTDP